jgi:cell division protein FtsB
MKEFSKFEIAVIKRTAQNVNPMVTKKNKIRKQIAALSEEYDTLDKMQEQYEASIKTMTGGYSTEDLVDKVIKDTGKVDKDGKPIKVTQYILKYPETIIPVSATVDENASADIAAMDETNEVAEAEVDNDMPFND